MFVKGTALTKLESGVLCLKYRAARAWAQSFKEPKVMIKCDMTCYGCERCTWLCPIRPSEPSSPTPMHSTSYSQTCAFNLSSQGPPFLPQWGMTPISCKNQSPASEAQLHALVNNNKWSWRSLVLGWCTCPITLLFGVEHRVACGKLQMWQCEESSLLPGCGTAGSLTPTALSISIRHHSQSSPMLLGTSSHVPIAGSAQFILRGLQFCIKLSFWSSTVF